MAKPGLNLRQQAFVREYLVDLNATQAAIRAGYKQPHSQGPRLLENVGIRSAIEAGRKEQERRTLIDADYVLTSIRRIGESAEQADDRSAALKAHELLGKHLRLFTDKIEHSGQVGVVEILVK